MGREDVHKVCKKDNAKGLHRVHCARRVGNKAHEAEMVPNTLLALFISSFTINVNQLSCHTWTHITFFFPTNCANQTGLFFEANLEHSRSLENRQNKTIQQNQRTDLGMVC